MATAKKAARTKPAARKAPARKAATPRAAATPPVKTAPTTAPRSTPAKAEKADKPDKPRKPKLVRDSFTIPKAEYTVLDELKQRAARAGMSSKKSEVLRAGIKALAALGDAAFAAAMAAVPAIKTGRPARD